MQTAALNPRGLAAAVLIAAVLALAASVASVAQGTAACSNFGTTWARSYNREAARDQNPIRIVSACCRPIIGSHLSSCLLTIGEVGVREHGCERVDISAAGAVASKGEHASCP